MLLGGRAGDLLGRRRVLLTGTTVFALSSLIGGFAGSAGVLVAARLAQGLGAAMMLPAALSLLTTSFKEGKDRNTALGVWGSVAGLASAAGVFLGGVLTEGPGWRWVLWVNPPIAVFLIGAIFVLIPGERRRAPLANFDILGTVLVTGGMLLLVYALVQAPDQGWGSVRTITELVGAGVLLAAFVINERRVRNPLIPLSVFRIRGLAAADVTQLVGVAGFLSMFFFLTLYMQNVLGFSPLQTGAAYLPLTAGVVVSAGISSQLLSRVGTRPLIIGGAAVVAAGLFYVSRVPLDGSYLTDLFPGLMIVSLRRRCHVRGRHHRRQRRRARRQGRTRCGAAQLLPSRSARPSGSRFSPRSRPPAPATCSPHTLAPAQALTSGFHRALFAGAIFVLATTVIAMRTNNSRGETQPELDDSQLERAEELV